MDQSIDDDAAILFSTGFYDALSAGKDLEKCYDEGILAVSMGGHDSSLIKLITV